jgi:hypothetical protein
VDKRYCISFSDGKKGLREKKMRQAWCWRCKERVPMLDEQEFAAVQDAYQVGAQEVKRARALDNRPLNESDERTLWSDVVARYFELTGASDVDPEEILRHRLSRLGPPCAKCGKELRSPQAKKCLECGSEVG